MQTSVTFYVENSVLDNRLDMKISYMNRVSCCLHKNQAVFIGEISTLTNYLKFNFEKVVEDCRNRQMKYCI